MKIYVGAGRAHLYCPDGHYVAEFVWQAGSEHVDHHQAELACGECGKPPGRHQGHDPWAAESIEVDGEGHKP